MRITEQAEGLLAIEVVVQGFEILRGAFPEKRLSISARACAPDRAKRISGEWTIHELITYLPVCMFNQQSQPECKRK